MHKLSHAFSAFVLTFLLLFYVPLPDTFADGSPIFTAEEQEYISEHPTLKVGFVADRIPISFSDNNGDSAGVSRYIFDRVSEISGIKFDLVKLPAGDVTYDYLLGEGLDLVTSVEFNEENKKARGILISKPYLSSRKVVVARNGLEFKAGVNYSVAVSTGSQTLKKVLANMFPNFQLKDYASITDCFDAVKKGDADFMIQNQYVVEYWLSKPKYEKLQVIPVVGLDDQLCFSAIVAFGDQVGPSQEDGQLLIDILDKTIDCISEDEVSNYIIQGVMDNQYKYTFGDFLYRYRMAASVFVVSLIAIFAMMILLMRMHMRFVESRADAYAKGRFLSTMSHEIRTPLNGLIGLNYLMAQKIDDKQKMSEYIRQSSVTAKYLLSLVNDILDSSKLEENKMELIIHPVDLGLVVNTVNSMVENGLSEKKMKFTISSELSYPYIMADEVRIQQILLNLLDNARKFTNRGGSVELSISQKPIDEKKVLTTAVVTDTGKGMSDEFQKQIFDVFSQELETVSKGNQGTGLGLSISRRLARLMGGDLTCVSKKGIGSSFTFTFTAEITDAPTSVNNKKIFSKEKRPHILVAEDNELNGEIILELLRSDGFEADIAEDGKKALKMFTDSAPGTYDVILMDLLMPEMDGFETAKAIRALDRADAETVRIYACTANSFSEERNKAFASGMDDFIAKPVDIDELLGKLYE